IGLGTPALKRGQYRMAAVRGGGTFTHQSTADAEFTASFTMLYEDIEGSYGISGLDWPDANWFNFTVVSDGTWNRWIFHFPLWILVVLPSIWPATALIQWIRGAQPTNICPACNYDLRGSVGSAACPECGVLIPKTGTGTG